MTLSRSFAGLEEINLSPRMSRPLGKKITWIGNVDKHRLLSSSNGRLYRIRRLILYIRYGYGK